MQCATHPSVETELACGKCEKPICPGCLHYTPVGVRCKDCANLRKLPQYNVSAGYLARAGGVALGLGAVLGAIWGVLLPFGTPFFFGILLGLGLGYVVGEGVSRIANRKVGPQLQTIAAGGVVVAYLVHGAILASSWHSVGIVDVMTRDIFGYVVVAIGIVIAVGRLR